MLWVVSTASSTDGAGAVDPAASPCKGVGTIGTPVQWLSQEDHFNKVSCYHSAHSRQRSRHDVLTPCGAGVADCCGR